MKYTLKLSLTFITIITLVSCKFSEQEIENLRNKYFRKMNLETFETLKEKKQSKKLQAGINYDPEKIKAIMDFLGVPENYTFFNETGAQKHVKDQKSCGCCWSHASTSALAYRYFLKNITVDLSPQNGLSCYIRDCDAGNYGIDSAMHLVKNGTVTEGCFPFQSGDGDTMPDCPTTCQDGSEYKKYYAQNVFSTDILYDEEHFYDLVTIILDQIYYHGPVVTSFEVYTDFFLWQYDAETCREQVYTYDGTSQFQGGHAVAVVGFGRIGEKYYWLLQNSWGEDVCDEGFVKVEMGQVGVEHVAFIEPYLPNDESEKKNVDLKYKGIDESCFINITTTSNYTEWENTVELTFKNKQYPNDRGFNFQCSMVKFNTYDHPYCFYEYYNAMLLHAGNYQVFSAKSLGTENLFNLDDTFKNLNFNYYGGNYLEELYSDVYFVSREGSNIMFLYDYEYGIRSNQPPIYPNANATEYLRDCFITDVPLYYASFLICKIKEDELKFFEKMSSPSDNPVLYQVDCGYKQPTEVSVFLLDTENYPVFKVSQFIVPEDKIVSIETDLYLFAKIEGSTEKFKNENQFFTLVDLEFNSTNYTVMALCDIDIDDLKKTVNDNYNITCNLMISGDDLQLDNLYLRDVYSPVDPEDPFDVIIPGIIKGGNYHAYSQNVKLSMFIILGLILLL